MLRLSLTILVVLALSGSVYGHGCVDSNGDSVPWWVVYKMPSANGNPAAQGGYTFAYADYNSPALTLQENTNLNDTNSPMLRTLKLGYAEDNAYFYYNDDWPDDTGAPSSRAHAKGVITASPTDHTGFWLVHSTPRWPYRGEASFPLKARTYGQSFLCMSITNATEWSEIGYQLQIDNVSVYDQNLPDWFLKIAPRFGPIADGPQPTDIPTFRTTMIGNGKFLSFAKDNSWYNMLYSKLVAPTLQVSLLAETWMRPKFPNVCGAFSVMNVQTMKMGEISWKETQDHSKVAISASPSELPFVCIGDINRMKSQKKRGGGTVCFEEPMLWRTLYNAITSYEKCP